MKSFDVKSNEDKILINHVFDKLSMSERNGFCTYTWFLNQVQQLKLKNVLKNVSTDTNVIFEGGYDRAERKVIMFCPNYYNPEEIKYEYLSAIKIEYNKKFSKTLNHRDYLGSILGLGIKREKIGDIIVFDNITQLIVAKDIIDFLLLNLIKIGNVNVRVEKLELNEILIKEQEFKEISTTVSSARLDSIVASAFSISRTKAVDFIKAGRVYLNYDECKSVDKTILDNDLVILRGKGKALIEICDLYTKKGRLKIKIKRYI